MPEVVVRVDVPAELKADFAAALEKMVNEMAEEWELSVARRLVSRSSLTAEKADDLALEIKKGIARRHGVL